MIKSPKTAFGIVYTAKRHPSQGIFCFLHYPIGKFPLDISPPRRNNFPLGKLLIANRIANAEELGRLVKGARALLGLTQPQLAMTAGVGVRFIVDLEKGKPTCQLGKALQVLRTLGITIDATLPSVGKLPGGAQGANPESPATDPARPAD